jgi:GTPase
VGDKPYIIVDTGGIEENNDPLMDGLTEVQVDQAIDQADKILFLVDGQSGLTSIDEAIAKKLRAIQHKVVLVINKADRKEAHMVSSEFYSLGLSEPFVIATAHNRGVGHLMEAVLSDIEVIEEPVDDGITRRVHMAIIGRPNVGKSTLINRMLGEPRVVVSDRAGTTRDSIYIPFDRHDQHYMLIDTAGVRRRTKVKEVVEKFSVIKTLQAIEKAHVVVMVINAREGIGEQDLRMIGWVIEAGKGLIIAFNKWDGMDQYDKDQIKSELSRKCVFVEWARRYFISALHGTGVGKLYRAVDEAYASANKDVSTADITRVLQQATTDHQPPLVSGRRVKLRYGHVGGHHPLTFILHGKQLSRLPGSYQRYLSNYFRTSFDLKGVPVVIRYRTDENPYAKK